MKNLKDYIKESLIKSYDTEELKKILSKKYGVKEFHDHKSKSDSPNRFSFTIKDNEFDNVYYNESFYKLIDWFGYTLTEVNCIENKIYDFHLEPNFGKKCNDLVYNECNGILWHVARKQYEKNINKDGLKPFEGNSYRIFKERVFLSCGKTKTEILDNLKDIIHQLNINDYVIYKINLKNKRKHAYNVNFYYDTSEDNKHNYIYANAIFFPQLIEESFHSIDEVEAHLKNTLTESFNHKLNRKLIIKNLN